MGYDLMVPELVNYIYQNLDLTVEKFINLINISSLITDTNFLLKLSLMKRYTAILHQIPEMFNIDFHDLFHTQIHKITKFQYDFCLHYDLLHNKITKSDNCSKHSIIGNDYLPIIMI